MDQERDLCKNTLEVRAVSFHPIAAGTFASGTFVRLFCRGNPSAKASRGNSGLLLDSPKITEIVVSGLTLFPEKEPVQEAGL